MSIITHPTADPTTPRRGSERTKRAPYQVGDHVRAVYRDLLHGTTLVLAAPVLAVAGPSPDHPDYPWTLVYEGDDEVRRDVQVNARGVDREERVEPSVSALALHDFATPAGVFAVTLALVLRRGGIAGPLATVSNGHVLVRVLWPSGRGRLRVGVEAHDGVPAFHITTWPDVDAADPEVRAEAYTVPQAFGTILPLLR